MNSWQPKLKKGLVLKKAGAFNFPNKRFVKNVYGKILILFRGNIYKKHAFFPLLNILKY